MKPKRLEFCGINSFSEKAVVDFDRLLAGGIFGIFGDTGSGKTTILDSMIFALYGKIDRTKGGNSGEIINYNCDKAYVKFDFECEWEGQRRLFRVERTIKKKNSQQDLELCEIEGDTVRAVSEGVKKTNEKILEIVGLSFDDFKKCIALPQGEFAQFVKADRGDRLRLISRLFDLEIYGDKLNAVLRRRYDEAKLKLAEKDGSLGEYAEYTPEALKILQTDYEALLEQKKELDKSYEEKRADFEKLKEEFARSQKLKEQRGLLERENARRPLFEAAKEALRKLPAAAAAVDSAAKAERAEKQIAACGEIAKNAAGCLAEAEKSLKEETEKFDAADYDNALADVRAKKTVLQTAEADLKELSENRAERERLAREYKEAAGKRAAAEKELSDIEKELAQLLRKADGEGQNSPEEFLRGNFESALLQSEYISSRDYFGEKLVALHKNFPHEGELYAAAEKELSERLAHYTRLCENEKFSDAAELLERFKASQAEQAALKDGAHKLELQREKSLSRLREAEISVARAADEGAKVKSKIDALAEKLAKLLGGDAASDVAAYIKKLTDRENSLMRARDASRAARERLRKSIGEAEVAVARAEEKAAALGKEREEAEKELAAKLSEAGFEKLDGARALLAEYPDPARLSEEIETYESGVRTIKAAIAALSEGGEPANIGEEEFSARAESFQTLGTSRERVGKECAVYKSNLDRFADKLEAKKILEKERGEIKKRYDLIEKLRRLFYGNAFMEFVAGEYLADISSAATETLLHLTNGRYFIRYEQGFLVGDNFNAGELRGVNTLSGGETFLVSLSLALALSAAIYAKSLRPIEFFFLDEGFGTLDEKLIDTVMDSLEKLKNTHFSIGLISHVEELKHRIGNKITVTSAQENGGSSKITISC